MTAYLERLGPVYDLMDGSRFQDLDGACGNCGKRLAEVIHDPSQQWNAGQIVCLDCGTVARASLAAHTVVVISSHRAPGKRLAVCRCGWFSMVTSSTQAETWADQHRTQHARGAA